jgi:hypothetical protein
MARRIYVSTRIPGTPVRVGTGLNVGGNAGRPRSHFNRASTGWVAASFLALTLLNLFTLVAFTPLVLVTAPATFFWIAYCNRRYDRKVAAEQARVKAAQDEAETIRAANANLTAQDRVWLVDNGWTPPA